MKEGSFDSLDPRALGAELQKARKRRGLTQAEAAEIIDVARTTMTAIEKGARRIRADELIKLARAYGREVSELVRSRPQIEPFQVQFRGPVHRLKEPEAGIDEYIDRLEDLCRNYLELEEIVGAPLAPEYPAPYDITGLETEAAAEDVAIQERNRLGLGDGPIPILRDILEHDVGLRIFFLPLRPSEYAAMYLFTEELGGCIAVNSLHPEERRRWSLAHDYGHFLVHRYRPTLFVENQYQRVPESERFADYFALFFLMPTSGLKRRFNNLRQAQEAITPADLCTLAHFYGVSVAALTRRLENMKLLPAGVWDRLRESGFQVREAQHELGLGSIPAREDRLPIRYQYLAVSAYDQGLISEGQLAKFLGVDRLEARRVAEKLRRHASDITNEAPLELDLTQSLPT